MDELGEDLLRTALRVLDAYADFEEPKGADVMRLRENAPDPGYDWAPDELACFLIRRELRLRRQPDELESARTEWWEDMAELNALISELPNGMPHSDGHLKIQQAGARRSAPTKSTWSR